MTRFVLRRLGIILPALLLINFFGYAYAHLVRPLRAARTPYLHTLVTTEPLLPTYASYLQRTLGLDFGTMPGGQGTIATTIASAATASLGLLGLALALSTLAGLILGLRAVHVDPPRVSRWLPFLSTVGLAMPSFYIGSLLILALFFYILWRPGTGMPIPWRGFGWDRHLVFPTLALMARPTVQIAQLTSGLLVDELGKQYIVAARSKGLPWRLVQGRHAMGNILASVILTIAGSLRLLVGELILVEWLFRWPGLGRLLAATLIPSPVSVSLGTPLFLNPPLVAALITVFAALFLVTDLVASVLVQIIDPRLRTPEGGTGHV